MLALATAHDEFGVHPVSPIRNYAFQQLVVALAYSAPGADMGCLGATVSVACDIWPTDIRYSREFEAVIYG